MKNAIWFVNDPTCLIQRMSVMLKTEMYFYQLPAVFSGTEKAQTTLERTGKAVPGAPHGQVSKAVIFNRCATRISKTGNP